VADDPVAKEGSAVVGSCALAAQSRSKVTIEKDTVQEFERKLKALEAENAALKVMNCLFMGWHIS
jgi:hypothetical protein